MNIPVHKYVAMELMAFQEWQYTCNFARWYQIAFQSDYTYLFMVTIFLQLDC